MHRNKPKIYVFSKKELLKVKYFTKKWQKSGGNMETFITVKNKLEQEDSLSFATKSYLILIDREFKEITLFRSGKSEKRSISELDLDPKRCVIKSAMLFNENTIYLNISKKNNSVGFFISLKEEEETVLEEQYFKESRVMSFLHYSISFHRRVISSFVPFENTICIVSKEGFSIHNKNLKSLFAVQMPIIKCCYTNSYILICDKTNFIIFKVESIGAVKLVFKKSISAVGIPKQIIELSHSLVLVMHNSNQSLSIYRISLNNGMKCSSIDLGSFFDVPIDGKRFSFNEYDDLLVLSDNETNMTILIDLIEAKCIRVGPIATPEFQLEYVFDGNNCYSTKSRTLFTFTVNYDKLVDPTKREIISLFRRKNALQTAISLCIECLRKAKSEEEIMKIISVIGPNAVNPVAQIRFVKAIQYSSLVDPHLILLALLRYSMMINEKMTDDARISVIEAISHSSCRHTFKNLMCVWNMKLNYPSVRAIMKNFGDDYSIEPEFVKDILGYADICIDFGKKDQARRLILRHVLDAEKSEFDLDSVKRKYVNKFGEQPF